MMLQSQHTANAMMSETPCAAKPFAMDLQAATMKAPGKRCDEASEVFGAFPFF
jgi:hypothetical protein